MKIKLIGFCVVFLFPCLLWLYQDKEAELVSIINQELANTPSASGHPVFDLLDASKITDSMYPWIGFPVIVLSEKQLFGVDDNVSVPPDEIKLKQKLLKYKHKKRIIFNIPSWRIANDKEGNILTAKHVEWTLQLLTWAKEVLPETNVGMFGLPYSPWHALKSTTHNIAEYQRIFEHLKAVMNASDTLYPLFQLSSFEQGDVFYLMGVHLYIAKTSGKPIYPVLSHKESVANGGAVIPFDILRLQCQFVRENADGMVWWTAEAEAWDRRWHDAVADVCFI